VPSRGPTAGSGTASRWRAPEGSRPCRVRGAPSGSERSPHATGDERDSASPSRWRRVPQRRLATQSTPREEHGLEPLPSVPRSRTPAQPQSGVAREGDAAGSSRWSRSQALAALPTACLEHLASAGRRHTYAKAVRLTPVALLGLVRPLDGRLSETLIASGALWAPLSPTGLRREYTKAAVDRPSSVWSCRREITGPWCARSTCDRGCALLDSPGCSGSGKHFHTSHQAPRPPAAMHLSTDVHKLWITAL
jgi:hypothetical protein